MIEELHKLYIEDLSKIVTYGKNPRPRVRHPGKWAKLPPLITLNEDMAGVKPPSLDGMPIDLVGRKVWVWSDLHFYHKNIIEFSERPYHNVDEMNEHLVANFNDYVGPNDVSIWVGDVGFGNETKINALVDQCNGYKILVLGNHDFHRRKRPFKLNFEEIHLIYAYETPEVSLCFSHYPMDNIPYPWVNVHGHLHAFPKPDTGHPLHFNVCCELHGYKPLPLDEVIRVAKNRVENYDE
jgi:calcineurin-like phosphoesterase family protein